MLSKRSLKNTLLLALVKIFMGTIYKTTICTLYDYYGFRNDFSLLRSFISWIVFFMVAFPYISFSDKNDLKSQIICLILTLSFLPCLVLYEYMETPFFFLMCIYYALIIFAANIIRFDIKWFNKINENFFIKILISFIGIFLSISILYIWKRYSNFHIQLDLNSVYKIRYIARSYKISKIMKIARSISMAIIPLILIYRLYEKKYILCLIYSFVQFINFSIDGTKAILFTTIAGLISFFIIRRGYNFSKAIPGGLLIINVMAFFETALFKRTFISLVIIRRAFFIPALLNYYFYEYFKNNGIDFYRQSILNRIVGKSQYSLTLAQEIGLNYFGRDTFNGNNGLFSDAYANLGLVGVIIMPFILAFFFECLRNSAGGLPSEIWTMCSISTYYYFTGSSFFTALFGHGLLSMCILLYFVQQVNKSNQQKPVHNQFLSIKNLRW